MAPFPILYTLMNYMLVKYDQVQQNVILWKKILIKILIL